MRGTCVGGRLVPASVRGSCRAERTGREDTEASDLPGNEEGRRTPVASCHALRSEPAGWKLRDAVVPGSGTDTQRWPSENVGRTTQWACSDGKRCSADSPYKVPR